MALKMNLNARYTLPFDHFVGLPGIGSVERRVGEEGRTPDTARTPRGGAGVLPTDRVIQKVFSLAEVAHSVPGDRLPKPVHERPTHPFEGRPPMEFLEGHNVAETRMTFFRAGVGGVGVKGLGFIRRRAGPRDEAVTALLGSTLETFIFDGEIRIGDVLCGESMIPSN